MKSAPFLLLPILFSLGELALGKEDAFAGRIQPLLTKYCQSCHNDEKMTSGVRVSHLDGKLEDRNLRLWEEIRSQVADEKMPPEDELQPTDSERQEFLLWIEQALHAARSRPVERNGSIRRLTVSQYRNTLRELLGLREDLTDVLPPDPPSKAGFTNNSQTLMLSPLQVESYLDIAERALELCIVDEQSKPSIQNFRVDLGKSINPTPINEALILGANNQLLENQDFIVAQLAAKKSFDFTPFYMRTKYRFNEGYEGNNTVRGWRDYDSIYHSVFACVRGNPGYPKGKAYEPIADGLLLRPAIPSHELFGVESTYGPKANFKISLRELPNEGNFKITIRAAKYEDALLLAPGTPRRDEAGAETLLVMNPIEPQELNVSQAGIYQVDVHIRPDDMTVTQDASRLKEDLVAAWNFTGDSIGKGRSREFPGQLTPGASLVDSPFGQALSVDGVSGSLVVERDTAMNVGDGEFTVAAWIRPSELRQGGIFCLGKYNWTHGWYFDMPDNRGILRIESANPANQTNGTVSSPAGTIRVNQWQHVAAVVRREANETRLYVNGYEVARGSIEPAALDNPNVALHIGRIQDAKLFKGEIDEVYFYRRALAVAEIQSLVEPGRKFAQAPPAEKPQELVLELGNRSFSGRLEPAFALVRLPAGPLRIATHYAGQASPNRIVLTKLEDKDDAAKSFSIFEQREPRVGVHVGLRRDCGSTFSAVGKPQPVAGTDLTTFAFEGAINDFPSPDVQKENDNYLAGVREIAVRSEYSDGRDMPRLLIGSVEFEGPYYESWPPETHRRIFIESDNKDDHKDDPRSYASEVLTSFASRAFRRPISVEEQQAILATWADSFETTGDFKRSIQDALAVTLISPQFLFLIEDSATPAPEDLTPYELASKLSYFLWNSPPDEALLKAAATGKLVDQLDSELERMIADPKFDYFASEFSRQWLGLEKLDVVETDVKRYPKLTRDVKVQLQSESIQFLKYLIRENLPASFLIRSDFILANEVVASYYGLGPETENGFEFIPIRHKRSDLGGVLTQAGILAGLSDGREANPVKRGAWLARKIVSEPPDDPPPNVPALDEDLTNLPLRERLERHRNQKGCVKCHLGIDPWGVPFESYDAGGLHSKNDADASSTLPDETRVADLAELRDYLADERIDQVAFGALKHLSEYAVGRDLSYNEVELLRRSGLKLKQDEYRMRDMIRFVIRSELFLKK
jgi:hypothetical protein